MSVSRVPALLSSAAVAALVLAGCADEEAPVSDPDSTPRTESTELAPDATSTAQVGGQEHAARAITTAEGVVTGSRAVDLDREDDEHFEITVVDDAREHEVTVSIDGARVIEQDEGDDVDTEDRERLTTATITMLDALETAMADRTGTVEEIELTTGDTGVVWEVTVRTEGEESELRIDAATGEQADLPPVGD